MNYYKIPGMKDPFKELFFFISPGLKLIRMRKQNEGIIFNIINGYKVFKYYYTDVQTEIVYMYTKREKDR